MVAAAGRMNQMPVFGISRRSVPVLSLGIAALGERMGELGPALLEATRSRSPQSQAIPAEIVQMAILAGLGAFVLLYAVAIYLPIFSLARGLS